MTRHVGFLLFPGIQALDVVGPYDVLTALPDTTLHMVWKDTQPLKSSAGMTIVPDSTYETCPPLDVLIVPGGVGINALLTDKPTVAWIRTQAARASYIGSVCTGSLLLGVAGLLKGKRATTHWGPHALLAEFGAIPVKERVVRDGNYISGGGVTAGIDFALTMLAELEGEEKAMTQQLYIEYAPAPPFNAGSPETAPKHIVDATIAATAERMAARKKMIPEAMAMHGPL